MGCLKIGDNKKPLTGLCFYLAVNFTKLDSATPTALVLEAVI